MWNSILSTIAGGAVAAGAGGLTSLIQARQAAQVRAEVRDREDQYRLHRDRVDAYIAFHAAIGSMRRILQNAANSAEEGNSRCRAARNDTHITYVRIALVGSTGVVAEARRMMIHIDAVTYGRAPFDSVVWNDALDGFQNAARYDLTGLKDLPTIISEVEWPAPPPHQFSE